MVAATDEDMVVLDSLVSSLLQVEQTLQGVLAAREGLLAVASRLAMSMAERGDGLDAADLTFRSVAAELATAVRVSDRTMQRRMAAAEELVERFPAVWQAQGVGRISAGHARVIADAGAHIDDRDARDAYARRAVEFAEQESANRLRPIAARLAEQYQPRPLQERHEQARAGRGVWVREREDGMAEFALLGPATLVRGAFNRLTAMGKALPDGDPRTLGQRRADLALDLLLTGAPAGHDTEDGLLAAIRAGVSVTVPVTTLMGRGRSQAAEIDGRCPIDARTARLLAGAASGWDRVLTHPITGGVLAVDRYRPSEALRRHLRGRDQRCRFPGCGMPVQDSDLDHTQDAACGGPTEDGNLSALCRRHHVLKHHSPWHVTQLGDGLLEWTSPTGRTYIDKPPPPHTVTFTDPRSSDDADGHSPPGTDGAGHLSPAPGDPWATLPDELLAPF